MHLLTWTMNSTTVNINILNYRDLNVNHKSPIPGRDYGGFWSICAPTFKWDYTELKINDSPILWEWEWVREGRECRHDCRPPSNVKATTRTTAPHWSRYHTATHFLNPQVRVKALSILRPTCLFSGDWRMPHISREICLPREWGMEEMCAQVIDPWLTPARLGDKVQRIKYIYDVQS